jgi:hypothetical protein
MITSKKIKQQNSMKYAFTIHKLAFSYRENNDFKNAKKLYLESASLYKKLGSFKNENEALKDANNLFNKKK